MIKITFPDNSVKEYAEGTTAMQIAESISSRLAQEVLAASVNGEIWDLTRPINQDAAIKLFKWEDEEGKHAFWHSSAHLMAEALQELYPGIKFGIGPAIENGFYYDVDPGEATIKEGDFPAIEAKMLELVAKKEEIKRQDISKADALKMFGDRGEEYKTELISELEDGKITTPYDSQADVYNKFFEELNGAIETLTANSDAKLVPTADYVYSGDVQKWIKFANSLKLRLAIRIAYADINKAREMAESAITQEFGVITKNEDNAAWNYFSTISNPLYTAVRYNEEQTGGDTHVAADIVCYMNGYNDPRRASYFEPSGWSGKEYVGLRRGINMKKADSYFSKYSRVNISASAPVMWMNAAEIAFLRAEGKAIFGFNMGGEAKDFYNEGIRLSFEQLGVSGYEQYIEDGTSVPENYTDPAGLNSYESTISDITIKWDENADLEKKQERIITQKWIANWMLGNEAWADYRRTGYPKLIPATTEGNLSGGIVNSNRGVRRMPYPLEEYTSNTENVQNAVNQYLKGIDNMSVDVWWACKPRNN